MYRTYDLIIILTINVMVSVSLNRMGLQIYQFEEDYLKILRSMKSIYFNRLLTHKIQTLLY